LDADQSAPLLGHKQVSGIHQGSAIPRLACKPNLKTTLAFE